MERDTEFESALAVWKTAVLTANTNPTYSARLSEPSSVFPLCRHGARGGIRTLNSDQDGGF